MSVEIDNEKPQEKCGFEDALNLTGFGKYNIHVLVTCCSLIVGMYVDIFGFSVILPNIGCDLQLSTSELALLSAMPLIGVMASSYAWGLYADTVGRRAALMLAMPVGMLLNLAASLSPTYAALASLKFLSACFTSSANAAGFVLLAENAPQKHRSAFMFLMASATLFTQSLVCVIALPVLTFTTFKLYIPWLMLDLEPWRLLMLIICIPGILGTFSLVLLHESPKFLFNKGHDSEALKILRVIYESNTRCAKETYLVRSVYLEEATLSDSSGIFRRVWNQTAPLFQRPLLSHNLKLYFILLCAFMTSTGFTMWVPTMTNAYFTGSDSSGKTFCEVASTSVSSRNTTYINCDAATSPSTLYAVILYSGVSGILNILLIFIVKPLGKQKTSIMIFGLTAFSGLLLLFIRIPLLSLALFYFFLYIALILGNANTYLIELNPTYLRGMVTCLSVVVARGFGFVSVQVIGFLLADHCTPMICGYIVLLICGLIVTCTLPPDHEMKNL